MSEKVINPQMWNHYRRMMKKLDKQLFFIKNVVWMSRLRKMCLEEVGRNKDEHFYKTMTMNGYCSTEFMYFSWYIVTMAICLDDGGVTEDEIKRFKIDKSLITKIKRFRQYTCHFNRLTSNKISNGVKHRELLNVKTLLDLFNETTKLSSVLYNVASMRHERLMADLSEALTLFANDLDQQIPEGDINHDLMYLISNGENDYILSGEWIKEL